MQLGGVHSGLQSEKAVSVYLYSKRMLLSDFAREYWCLYIDITLAYTCTLSSGVHSVVVYTQ